MDGPGIETVLNPPILESTPTTLETMLETQFETMLEVQLYYGGDWVQLVLYVIEMGTVPMLSLQSTDAQYAKNDVDFF